MSPPTAISPSLPATHGTVELLHPASGLHKIIEIGGPIGSVRFRGDGQMLLVARTDERSILAIDVATQQIVAELPLAMEPEHLCFNADQGQLFVTGKGYGRRRHRLPLQNHGSRPNVLAARNPGVMAASDKP